MNHQGRLEKNGCTYIKTNIRMERPVLWQFMKARNFETIVVFGHEWAFDEDRKRLEFVIKTLHKNGVNFV